MCENGIGFRAYVDAQMTGALKISRLVERMSNSDIEDEPGDISGDSVKKKLRVSPSGGMRVEPQIGGGSGAVGIQSLGRCQIPGPEKERALESGYHGGWEPADHFC